MVNVLYNEHTMTDAEEKENYLAFLKESVALDRALLALRTIEEKEAIDVVEAEIRCMEESGDINTLENYYREAADEASDKKEGIISKVWEFIKDMLIKIKDFLVGSKQSKRLDEDAKNNKEYAFDDEGEESFSYLKKITYALKGGEGGIKNLFNDKKTWAILLGTAALAGGAVALTASKNKHKASEVKTVKDDIVTYVSMGVDKIKEILGKASSFVGENAENLAKKIVGFLNKAKSWLFSLLNISQDDSEAELPGEKYEALPDKQKEANDEMARRDKKADINMERNSRRKRELQRKVREKGKRISDLSIKEQNEYRKRREEILETAKNNKQKRTGLEKLLKEFGVVGESTDDELINDVLDYMIESGDDIIESLFESVDDVFDIPEFLSEESTEDIDDISSLLESL